MRKRKFLFVLLTILLLFLLCACNSGGVMETIQSPFPSEAVKESVSSFEPESAKTESYAEKLRISVPTEAEIPDKSELDESEQCCTLMVRCDSVLKNIDKLDQRKSDLIPSDGFILQKVKLAFSTGESVFDVLYRTLKDKGIHIEFVNASMYNSVYVEGIGNLYEFDCGDTSGWTYTVNGESPMHGASQHMVEAGDEIEFVYKCSIFE